MYLVYTLNVLNIVRNYRPIISTIVCIWLIDQILNLFLICYIMLVLH